VASGELRVEQGEVARAQQLDQVDQADLGRVGPADLGPTEHALPKEGAAQVHAVEPADQGSAEPGLHAVREAPAVKLAVGADQALVDPGLLAFRSRLRAGAHHVLEARIGADLEARGAHDARQAAGDVKPIEREDRARIGAEPLDLTRPAVDHREDPIGIGPEQQLRRGVLRVAPAPLVVRHAQPLSELASRDSSPPGTEQAGLPQR
jgi:hypothetical protein